MEPKVWGKLLTHHRRGYGVDVEAHGRFPLRLSAGKGPKMGSHGYRRLRRWKSGFVAPPDVFRVYGYIYIGERSRSGEPRGAHEGGGAPTPWARLPASWPPHRFLDVHSKSPGLHLFQKSLSWRFHSVWIPFDIPFLRSTETGKNNNLH